MSVPVTGVWFVDLMMIVVLMKNVNLPIPLTILSVCVKMAAVMISLNASVEKEKSMICQLQFSQVSIYPLIFLLNSCYLRAGIKYQYKRRKEGLYNRIHGNISKFYKKKSVIK